MKRPRPRMLLMVLLLLTGGAILNVAVAWGCACWSSTPAFYPALYETLPANTAWFEMSPREWPPPNEGGNVTGLGWTVVRQVYDNPGTVDDDGIVDCGFSWYRSGLPCMSLESKALTILRGKSVREIVRCGDGGQFKFGQKGRRIPLQPIWPGFAINTIFYAAILWLLFAAPGFVRRRIRARRGQCPACAYPVGASDVCTECGRPVRIPNP